MRGHGSFGKHDLPYLSSYSRELKDDSFHKEEEVRLIYNATRAIGEPEWFEKGFPSRHSLLVPHVKVRLDRKALKPEEENVPFPIEAILVGPGPHAALMKHALILMQATYLRKIV